MHFDASLAPYRIVYRAYCTVKNRWELMDINYCELVNAIDDYHFLVESREVQYCLLFAGDKCEPILSHSRSMIPISVRLKIGFRRIKNQLTNRVNAIRGRDKYILTECEV